MSQEVVQMKARGFICVNAHPAGCARNVEQQVETVKRAIPQKLEGVRNVLVIGASTGYGLASRIAAAWGFQARTVGVFFERAPQGHRTGTAGFYNTAAFHRLAQRDGLEAWSLNGDAFSDELKQQTVALLQEKVGPVDLVIYSLASPKRTNPRTGTTHNSTLKPVGQSYSSTTIDLDRQKLMDVTIEPANEAEVADTIAVMGGDDWRQWIEVLLEAGVLNQGVRTVAYSYIGPEVTWPIYKDGTIGQAKKDVDRTAKSLDQVLQQKLGGHAWVSVNKAIVTQASAAIPVVPLYMSILIKVMRQKGLEEGAIEQMTRLVTDHLARQPKLDEEGRIRLDDWEMRPDVQQAVAELWPQVTSENLMQTTDYAAFQHGFRKLFGFEMDGIDYSQPVEVEVAW